MVSRKFCLILVKPSHYDNDGYVIQWYRSAIPSNTLASLHGLALDCAERHVLGDNVEIEIHAHDECNTLIKPDEIARRIERAGAGMVMLVGVQSNQFPRALDIARPLKARGIQVCIGGFHVSGVLSMLDGKDAHLDQARAMGLSLFAGESEGRMELVLRDAYAHALKPLYNYMDDLPQIEGTPIPFLHASKVVRTAGGVTSFDAGRGCPYQCSFCTIINVQGRKSRRRSPDDVERILRKNFEHGIDRFFITDDNFARNKDWEPILDRLIYLREVEKMPIGIIIQVDTLCHKLPNFVEKSARAGVKRVFIGLENINPANLMGAKKRQNKITEYRKMLLAWKNARVLTYAGYIIGFPGDTLDSVMNDIEVIKRELPVDLLEFFYLTPLPGSEDHQKLFRAGVAMDPDLNKYDLNNLTTAHPKMSQAEWKEAYDKAWEHYYTDEHIVTVIKRAAAMKANASNALFLATWFSGSIRIEHIHPLESGFLRRKFRTARRPGYPIVSPLAFYPGYWVETVAKLFKWGSLYLRLRREYLKVKHDPKKLQYTDLALTPVTDDEEDGDRELFNTDSAKAYVAQEHRLDKFRHGEAA